MVLYAAASKPGFDLIYKSNSFKCAFITRSEQYAPEKITSMKRHNESDEVFVLIRGNAILLTGEDTLSLHKETVLQQGISYCVKAGTWHYLAVSEDALVFVTENGWVSAKNTEEICVKDRHLAVEV